MNVEHTPPLSRTATHPRSPVSSPRPAPPSVPLVAASGFPQIPVPVISIQQRPRDSLFILTTHTRTLHVFSLRPCEPCTSRSVPHSSLIDRGRSALAEAFPKPTASPLGQVDSASNRSRPTKADSRKPSGPVYTFIPSFPSLSLCSCPRVTVDRRSFYIPDPPATTHPSAFLP